MTILITIILLLIAATHALWGLGIWFPVRTEESLAHAVVGAKGVSRMPGPIPCFLVVAALGIVIAALWMPPWAIRSAILWIAVVMFFLRGLIPYLKIWRRLASEEPFASYDRKYYGPLCLALGAGLAFVTLGVA
ncbi:DUF3995 domain-containing protein [Yoonia sp.]|uniref:DUF3995 domain-containing protein n=1 Tax=Yoonia sp. TaxID=2212373 RepID=UPI0025FFB244|nr:DUF3995 domain-containing protein [Yoonia sp.]